MTQFTRFSCTLNNYAPSHLLDVRGWAAQLPTYGACKVVYLVGQEEKGDQGTPHLQMYFEIAPKKTVMGFKRFLTSLGGMKWITVHVEVSRSDAATNTAYCTKLPSRVPGTEPFLGGVPAAERHRAAAASGGRKRGLPKGARCDLLYAAGVLKTGGMSAVAALAPDCLARYPAGLAKLDEYYHPAKTSWVPKKLVILFSWRS